VRQFAHHCRVTNRPNRNWSSAGITHAPSPTHYGAVCMHALTSRYNCVSKPDSAWQRCRPICTHLFAVWLS